MDTLTSKLNEVKNRYHEITHRLADPQIHQNPKEYQAVAKEAANLRPIVENFSIFEKKQNELNEAKTLLEEENDHGIRDMAKQEIAQLEKDLIELRQSLQIQLLPTDPNDDKNIYLEIRAGTGGEEAALFAADLFRMYSRFSEEQGWISEIISANDTGIGGYKEIITRISGDHVYSKLKHERGVHRVQRIPQTETQGRVHTSAVTVAVLPEVDDVEVEINDKDLRIDVFRSGGHGGQSVNTTDSAVRITHLPSGLVVVCQDEKSQHKNKAKALKVLRARLYDQKLEEQKASEASSRKEQVGSGDRSEKIRTYNFPQNRITDHRIGLTLHQLDSIIHGKLDLIINPLIAHYQAELLQNKAG